MDPCMRCGDSARGPNALCPRCEGEERTEDERQREYEWQEAERERDSDEGSV